MVLRCTYRGAFETLKRTIDEVQPAAIISTGLASRVRGIRFETIGRNIMQGKYADADGYDPKGESILNGGEEFVDANSDAYTLTKILRRKGIPTEISVDAELFICNSLLYLTSEYIQRAHLPMKNVFFHTPWTDAHRKREELEEEKTLITQNMLHDAIEAIVMNIE